MADRLYSEADKMRTFNGFMTLVSTKMDVVENGKKRVDDLHSEWIPIRQDSIKQLGEIAELIKKNNDGAIPVKAGLKGVCAGAEILCFVGPGPAALGAGVAAVANLCYCGFSANTMVELEKHLDKAKSVLEEDKRITNRLIHQMKHMTINCEEINELVKEFHSATVKGFFDNVPSLRSLVRSIAAIPAITKPEDYIQILTVICSEVAGLCIGPSLKTSLSALYSYNHGFFELVVNLPNIAVNAGLFCMAASGGGLGKITTGLNITAIIHDISQCVLILKQYNEYPIMSKRLLEAKEKLKTQEGEINFAVKNFK